MEQGRSYYWAGWLAWAVTGIFGVIGFLALLSIGAIFLIGAAPAVVLGVMTWRHVSQLLGLPVGGGLGIALLGLLQARAPRANCSPLYNEADAAAFCAPPPMQGWLAFGGVLMLVGALATLWMRRTQK